MSLQTNLQDLATRAATESKAIRTLLNGNQSSLAALTTTAKNNLVAAINELDAAIDALSAGAAGINDTVTATTSTWSSTKTSAEIGGLILDSSSATTKTWSASKIAAAIATAKSELVNGAGAALDTLNELAAALGNDANFASTTTTALGNRVRFDAAQTLTSGQKTQACANLGLGEPETDLVATFNAGLV